MRKSLLKPILWVVFILVFLAALLLWYLTSKNSKAAAGAAYPPIKVAVAQVKWSQAPRTIHAIGELEAAKQIQLASEVAGRIEKIYFQSGQFVHQGQLLLQLNDDVEQAELAQLQAKLKLDQAVYRRGQELSQVNAMSRAEVDEALSNRDVTLGKIQQLRARIQQKAIRAPFAGQIGIRRVHQGQYLQVGEPIVSLVDTQNLLLNFSLDERVVPDIALGQQLNVQLDAFAGQQFKAKVTAIDPLISKARLLQVQAQLPNPKQQFKAGMFANVLIDQQRVNALMVPESAISYSAYGETVFVATAQQAQWQVKKVAVKTGQRADGWVEVSSGLKQGQRVVTSGQLKLSDGAAVELMKGDTLETGTDQGAASEAHT
ncbi:efflux RND transporter periplasmic adaptor subunit [Acinetobacter larvae]|uniref:Efflux transporter periplasmic adaptor subunit n=1 Tax=Acinetobacter larvae TaxID=1789224 RepID=A0A1B2LZ18_9GAMM|nr:efflux RND transporter periplasmic adaptor subunit [Acinetobacter larvae]AOA58023.1 efflux transporter periplasmic adaptor subunit [Acinetobacter larvae]